MGWSVGIIFGHIMYVGSGSLAVEIWFILACWIGERLLGLQHLPHPLIVFTVTVISVVTEVISNVATTTLFLPVLASLVRKQFDNKRKNPNNFPHIVHMV